MSERYQHSTTTMTYPLILLLALLTALDAMAIDMYLPAMPALAMDFGASSGKVQQTLSVFLVGLALGQGICGPLLDRYGRRVPLLAGLVIFIGGSVMAALSPSIEWLMLARFLQALGASAGLVAPRAIVADLYSVAESARIFSLLMQVMMIAPILAPLLGGYLLAHGEWRLVFWVLAGLGVAGLIWGIRIIPESLSEEKRLASRAGNLSPGNIVRAYVQQFGYGVFMAYTLAGGVIFGSLFVYISSSSFVFTQSFGLTPAQFSYIFAANAVSLVIGGQISTTLLRRRVGEQRIMMFGIVIHILAGLVLSILILAEGIGLWGYLLLLATTIGTLGLVFGNLTALTMANAGGQAGVASALMGMLQYLIAALVGYGASQVLPGPVVLPVVIVLCGVAAMLLCILANRMAQTAFSTCYGDRE
ncbi:MULTISPECIES: multidrug effflux MFS transporter [Dickeya]|uniref:multidrug effflux MFS transporter n=1 Tax=Dickeya TaxID=204037 RepID=UPI0005B480D1|nr:MULTISPECIES: multidrug effflux MFS transporter [Dickeya]WKV48727.1 multidrug effflux MFS transporter [Dickeya fangzhongdai]